LPVALPFFQFCGIVFIFTAGLSFKFRFELFFFTTVLSFELRLGVFFFLDFRFELFGLQQGIEILLSKVFLLPPVVPNGFQILGIDVNFKQPPHHFFEICEPHFIFPLAPLKDLGVCYIFKFFDFLNNRES
jgi:hypothetical protein